MFVISSLDVNVADMISWFADGIKCSGHGQWGMLSNCIAWYVPAAKFGRAMAMANLILPSVR